ncbi:hypothetical protein [Clostridium sp. 'White wine YQ']|uniref:hypothetical protein n=1 Tax=Clostridium sp. 'White wine YQ' TaxID=3027474 RepID=UPI0023652722|nr:hypothetical protein [Clostridium sp. 'White wine YQ']MDD7792775.1 hypothetical protein [Clostridium sp. 'White wine YQ']
MSSKAINFIKNFSYTLVSNLLSMLVSSLVILVVPRFTGVNEYGYLQVYLFYSSYVGFLHFGWNDGIYLRYGGKKYEELDKKLFFSQFYMMVILQLVLATIMFFIFPIWFTDIDKIFILKMISINLLIMNILTMLLFILQATNRIKEYAQITAMSRILYFLLTIVIIICGFRSYKLIVLSDLIGKSISLLYAMYCCSDIVLRKLSIFYFSFKETKDNINAGIKLLFANIASNLIIGVVRAGVERSWNVKTFGKVSLTLSISNLMMIFINAIGIVMFPILRRTNEERLSSIYEAMRDFLMVVLLGALIIYYPLKVVLSAWLPKYADSLMFMALVFPMCVFEGKMALLINTYLKTLRKEKLMLKINLISLVLSIILTILSTILFKNLNLAIVSIVILLAFRCIFAEMFLSKILNISLYKDIALELTMTLIFILTGWFIDSWITVFIYIVAYIAYLFIKRKDITKTIKNIKLLMKT